MSIPLPLFVAIPLATAFFLPILGGRGKKVATLLANLATGSLLAFAILSIGKQGVYQVGKWPIPLGINLVLDGLSALLLLSIGVVSAAAMLFSVRYMEQYTAKAKYLSLFLLMVAGMNGVVLSGDIFNLFVFLEIASIASYALVGFGCGAEELEASFKYMVLGSIGSILVLFAIALTYGNTGSLNMAYISVRFERRTRLCPISIHCGVRAEGGFGAFPRLASGCTSVGAGSNIGDAVRGIDQGARGVVFNVFGVSLPVAWILTTLGIVSMIAGAFLALGQSDFKRLLAYSSISQIGYVVLGIGLGGLIISRGGSLTWASLAFFGALFHMINHSVYKSLLFLTSGSVEMSTGTRQLQQMGGLAGKLPFTRATCTVASASIAGVPPFSGFWSKLIMVIAAVQARFIWVAAIIVFVSVCTLIMYLKVQDLPDNLRNIKEERGSMVVAMVVLAVLCVCMGLLVIIPTLKINILDPAVKALIDGLGYSARVISMGSM